MFLKLTFLEGISIHALREEGDPDFGLFQRVRGYFYPRPPRGGRLPSFLTKILIFTISIHALREEGDKCDNYKVVDGK